MKAKIPVSIVTGFLGAGKTTFINNLLRQNQGVSIGLIENEFGDVSIDPKLIANYQPASILELNNGCICCSIFNELSLSLQEFIRKNPQLEQLIIETSGVTDPGPVIEQFFRDPDLLRLFELCATICLVDAVNFQEEIGGFEQQKQIMLSDLVVLNKAKDADPEKLVAIREKIAVLNSTATVAETNFGLLDSAQLHILQPQIQEDFVKKLCRPIYLRQEKSEFKSFTIRFDGFPDEQSFMDWFNYFASLYRKQLFRIKGIVNFRNNPFTTIVQSVGGTTAISEGPVSNPYGTNENVLVFIGKDFDKSEIEEIFQQFLAENEKVG